MPVRELPLVDLRLDVDALRAEHGEAGDLDLVVEVPMLPTMALCFIAAMCSPVMMFLVAGRRDEHVGGGDDVLEGLDVVALHAGLDAQIGSISVTVTRAPWARSEAAEPLPTSP